MMKTKKIITVFEHDKLVLGKKYNDDIVFNEKHLEALEKFHGDKSKYYRLIHKGIKFKQYVGVLQIGNLTIEVLPKADNNNEKEDYWRKILIDMMRAVGLFKLHAPSSSSLNIKTNFLLDLYFELFIREVEYLMNKGLVKKYRKTEGNRYALKGNILFGKHIQQNIVHQERFYVRHTIYDREHPIHQVLYKTIRLLKRINTHIDLNSRIGSLLLNFPEQPDIKVIESTFKKIRPNRKTAPYQSALDIARLLLLNYHPDVNRGQNHVLALMFDMNMLWEKFVLKSLKKTLPAEKYTVKGQERKDFWLGKTYSYMKPDIVVYEIGSNKKLIFDTKWKNMADKSPSIDYLRQLYVYLDYFNADVGALVYPSSSKKEEEISGRYYDTKREQGMSSRYCHLEGIPVSNEKGIKAWQKAIGEQLVLMFKDKGKVVNLTDDPS